MKSGNLNFLEPSRPLQACNGTALPLPFTGVLLKYAIKVHYFVWAYVKEMILGSNPLHGLLHRPAGRAET